MCSIISFYNGKGGVGKTTSAVNIGSCLALKGNRVLLVDLDGQANATMSLRIPVNPDTPTVYDSLIERSPMRVIRSKSHVDVVPSDTRMYQLEQMMASVPDRGWVLSGLVEQARGNYDYIILDCPPAFGLASTNALIACDYVVLVSNMSGLAKMTTDSIKDIIETSFSLSGRRKIIGLLWTMNRYTTENKIVAESVDIAYPPLAFRQVIRMSTYISEAASSGKDIFSYMPDCHAAHDYFSVTEEIATRIQTITLKNYGK